MPGQILLLGSSIVSKWPSPRGLSVVNKGISGLLAQDLQEYATRALAYRGTPTTVLIYCGGNDVRAGTDPKEAADRIAQFVAAATKKWPASDIVLLAVLLSPSIRANPAYLRAAQSINRRLRLHVSKRPAVKMTAFSSENYAKDGTHLTMAGYRELTAHVFHA
jgi:lysophospholipase L1-like esterase